MAKEKIIQFINHNLAIMSGHLFLWPTSVWNRIEDGRLRVLEITKVIARVRPTSKKKEWVP
jgi:hypothetical protein